MLAHIKPVTHHSHLAPEVPYCSVLLAVCAAICHSIALGGNLKVAQGLTNLGESTGGWSEVGLSMAHGLQADLDVTMQDVTRSLTDAVRALRTVKALTHDVLAVDEASIDHVAEAAFIDRAATSNRTGMLALEMERFHDLILRVLSKVQQWLEDLNPRLRSVLEAFSQGVDAAQKIIDQVLSQLRGSGNNEVEMLRESFNLFDVSNTGEVTLSDLQGVSRIYGVAALTGDKAKELLHKHDADASDAIDREEFAKLTRDPAIPGAMALVLRRYARIQAELAGRLVGVRMRGEAAGAVAEFITVSCAKNSSSVSWVSEALGNGSLPMEFAADILGQLAMNAELPDQLTSVDVGAIVVTEMAESNEASVAEAIALLANASFWASQGFDPALQNDSLRRVAGWAAGAGETVGASLLRRWAGSPNATLPGYDTAATAMEEEAQALDDDDEAALFQCCGKGGVQKDYEDACLLQGRLPPKPRSGGADAALEAPRRRSAAAEAPPRRVGRAAPPASAPGVASPRSSSSFDADVLRAALQEHLERSRRSGLLQGRREQARRRRGLAARGTAQLPQGWFEESDPAEARRVLGAGEPAKPETLRFLHWLASNSSREARKLQEQCFDYTLESSGALDSIAPAVSAMLTRFRAFLRLLEKFATPRAVKQSKKWIGILVQTLRGHANASLLPPEAKRMLVQAAPLLRKMEEVLPACIDALQLARKEVASTAAVLTSLFGVMEQKAPPVFFDVSKVYRFVWVVYYAVFLVLIGLTVGYSFWASGLLTEEGAEGAAPLRDRSGQRAHHCSFWSGVLFLETLWLAMFVATTLITVAFFVRGLAAAGCQPIYLLGESSLCTEALRAVAQWLGSEDWVAMPLDEVCESKNLLICRILSEKLKAAMLWTAVCNTLAALLTFQLIVESAVLHQRRMERRALKEVD